jgi:Ribbon-helix-helix protein, copG family
MARLKTANPYGDDFFAGPAQPAATPAPPEQEPTAEPGPVVAPEKGSTVRLNLDLDREMHRRLKQMALDTDRSVADVVRELIAHALSAHSLE